MKSKCIQVISEHTAETPLVAIDDDLNENTLEQLTTMYGWSAKAQLCTYIALTIVMDALGYVVQAAEEVRRHGERNVGGDKWHVGLQGKLSHIGRQRQGRAGDG